MITTEKLQKERVFGIELTSFQGHSGKPPPSFIYLVHFWFMLIQS